MSPLTMPPVIHVTVEPARIPTTFSDPRFTIGAGGGVDTTITVAVPKIAPLVARTVLSNCPGTAPAVKRPDAALMVPPPLVTDQTGVIATTLPPASLPTAVNCCVAFVCTVAGFGVTVMVASAPVPMTVALPETEPLVATTVLGNVPDAPPAVKRPVPATMLPPPAATVQTGVIGTMLPPASLPTAVNCCWAPGASVAGFGVTVIVASGPTVTMTVAVPEIAPLVALTVLANVPVVVPAVKRPEAALMLPPPATTDQTGVIATTFPVASLPTAVNCCVVLIGSVAGFGVTVIDASAPGATMTVAKTVMPLHVTATVFV